MSKTIDERVVSMKFDNSNFERNVSVSMSTLDKLKAKLNFKGAEKGLESINTAAKNVNMSGLGSAVETVQAKFSALDVVAVTALGNITNKAVNAATSLAKSLTLDPIMDGFREYETQMNSVQTILANTQSKGSTLDDVTKSLNELNEYADKTIYNFTEMTRNIGTFTAAGVELDKSVTSIKGIANLAAVSGSTSQQASTAMYQLSQALAAGKVQLMDWNSVVNAGMGGELFQNALKRTATQMGYNVDALIEKYGSFRESLTQGEWLTADVLTETLTQLSGAYSEADLIAQGYSEKQAKEIVELSNTAIDAATKVKTFSQLIDTLKEAVGSGWAQTWQIIFGDFEQAKEVFTGLSDFFGGIINAVSDARNNFLRGALGSRFDEFTDKINKAGISTDDFQKKLKEIAKGSDVDLDKLVKECGSLDEAMRSGKISTGMITETLKSFAGQTDKTKKSTEDLNKKLKYFQEVVSDVWMGDYKNGEERVKALTKAGYDYAEVQALVNKTVDGHKLTLDDLSETQLKAVGYTDEEVKAIQELAAEAEKAGTPVNKLIESLTRPTGRDLFIDSIKNIFQPFITIANSLKEAWRDAFDPLTGDGLWHVINTFHTLTEAFVINEDNAEKLTRTFKGLFAILDLITSVVGGGFKIAFGIIGKVIEEVAKALGFVNTDVLSIILDFTASIGDVIVKVRDWIEANNILYKAIEVIVPILVDLVKGIIDWIAAFKDLPIVQETISKVSDAFKAIGDTINKYLSGGITTIKEFVANLKEMDAISPENIENAMIRIKDAVVNTFKNLDNMMGNIPSNIISGLSNGLQEGIGKVVQVVGDIATKIIETIKSFLGIHSPSTVMYDIGGNVMSGLFNGIQNGISGLGSLLKSVVDAILGAFSSIDFGSLFVVGSLGGIFYTLKKFSDTLEVFAKPFETFAGVFEKLGGVFESTSGLIDAKAKAVKSESLLNMAKAIALLAASLVILSFVDPAKLAISVGVVVALGAGLVALLKVSEKLGGADGKTVAKLSATMLSFASALLIMSGAFKILSTIDAEGARVAVALLIGVVASLAILIYQFDKLSYFGQENIDKVGKLISKFASSMLILSIALKIIGTLSITDLGKAAAVVGGVTVVFLLLGTIARSGDNADKAGKMFKSLGTTMLLLSVAMIIMKTLSIGDIIKGLGVLAVVSLIFTYFRAMSAVGPNADKAGRLFQKLGTTMLILAVAMKIIGSMSLIDVAKGVGVMGAVMVLFTVLGVVAGLLDSIGANFDSFGKYILKISASMILMGIAIKVMAGIPVTDVAKGLIVIGLVGALFRALTAVSKYSGENASKAGTMILKMSASMILIGVAMKIIAGIDPGDALKGVLVVTAISVLFGALTVLSAFSGAYSDKVGTMMLKMSASLLILVGAIAILTLLDTTKVAVGTACIAALMGMFALIMYMTKYVQKSTATLILISVAVGVLGGVLFLVGQLPVERAISSTGALVVLMGSMAVALALLGRMKTPSAKAYLAVGAMMLIIVALAGVLYWLKDVHTETATATANAISELLLVMTTVLAALAIIGDFASSAIAGLKALGIFVAGLAVVVGAFAGLNALIPDLESFLNGGIMVLQKLGEALGAFVGGIVAGFMDAATSGLPKLADNLSMFMVRLTPFIAGASMVKPEVFQGIEALAKAILMLTAADILEGIAGWLTGGNSLVQFAEQLVPFGMALAMYGEVVKNVDAEAIKASAQAAQGLTEVANAIPAEGGIIQKIMGEKDLSSFGRKLADFGLGMMMYGMAVEGINCEAITASAEAAKGLTEVANQVPSEGGVWQNIVGQKDLASFGFKLSSFGLGMMMYGMAVNGLPIEAIMSSVDAAKALTDVANAVPPDGGVWQVFAGSQDLSTFGSTLKSFGEGIADYAKAVGGITPDQITAMTATIDAAKALAGIAEALPPENGVLQWWCGEKDLSGFGDNLGDFGDGIADYADAIVGVDAAALAATTDSVVALCESLATMKDVGLDGVKNFAASIEMLAGVDISGMVEKFKGQTSSLKFIGQTITENLTSGMKNAASGATEAAQNVVDNMKKAVEGSLDAFKTSGSNIATRIKDGFDVKKSELTAKLESTMNSAKTTVRNFYDDFKEAGGYLVDGFTAGISENSFKAAAEASAMAASAKRAAERELDEHSPSKEFYRIGAFAGQGFVNALGDYASVAYNVSSDVAKSAKNGLGDSIAKISELINSDVDVNPVISPVVDLSNVAEGANAINGMFGLSPSIAGITADAQSLNYRMNRIQNGASNDDVVSAINSLRKSMDDASGDTYNVNGITYDDGSNVSNAVRSLIRAARVERRK